MNLTRRSLLLGAAAPPGRNVAHRRCRTATAFLYRSLRSECQEFAANFSTENHVRTLECV